MQAENVDRSAFAGAGDTGNADTARIARVWEAFFDDLLGDSVVVGLDAFDESYGTGKHSYVAFDDTVDQVGNGRERFAAVTFEVGVDRRRLGHARVNGEADVLFVVFGMSHNK